MQRHLFPALPLESAHCAPQRLARIQPPPLPKRTTFRQQRPTAQRDGKSLSLSHTCMAALCQPSRILELATDASPRFAVGTRAHEFRNSPVCEISRTCQKRLVIGVLQTRFSHLEFFAF